MRDKHTFVFKAWTIRDAAIRAAEYHIGRGGYWRKEYEQSLATVKQTAHIEVREYDVTGGKRAELSINYGDASAYSRMQEAFTKIQSHRQAAERYESDAVLYGSQDSLKLYELSPDDVHYFRLDGTLKVDDEG